MQTIEQIFGVNKILPSIMLEDVDSALPVIEVLLEANINVLSVRILSPNSFKILRSIVDKFPQMNIGASGVLDAAGFLNASLAKARFISSPGTTVELFTAARTRYNDAHFLPGVINPTQVMEAYTRGFNIMNIFPAEVFNGVSLTKFYYDIFPQIKFAVGGGIIVEDMEKYLRLPNVVAVGLPSITSPELIAKRDYQEIRYRAETATNIAKSILVADKISQT